MIRRHYLVEIKRVKELPLSTLLPPHHGPLPRITSQSDGITVRPWSQREFCNTFGGKADIGQRLLIHALMQERPARFLPGVDAALDVTGGGETRILRGLHRHGRAFAEGAIED